MKKVWKIVAILLLLVLLTACDPKGLFNPTTPPSDTSHTTGTDEPPLEEQPEYEEPNPYQPSQEDPPVQEPPVEDPPAEEPPVQEKFENYGLPIIDIRLSEVNISESGKYTSLKEVATYLHLYNRLPSNFVVKKNFKKGNVTSSNKLSVGGDHFGNYEGLLPNGKSYRECDIDYRGGSRNAKRIVFSSDGLIFYTSDHYESFSIVRFLP